MNLSSGYGTPKQEPKTGQHYNMNIQNDSISKQYNSQQPNQPREIQIGDHLALPHQIGEMGKVLTPGHNKNKEDSVNYGDLSLNESNDLG